MYSTGWVNQFEIKDTCIEIVTNRVSLQGKMKIKLNVYVYIGAYIYIYIYIYIIYISSRII